jgi:uncharacterized membrane protein
VKRDEILVSTALRAGVALAAAFSVVGAGLYFAQGVPTRGYDVFRPASVHPGWSGLGLMAIGVLILLATPIFRVALLIVVFAREHDRLYTVISAIVLAVLIFGLHG